MAEDDGNKQAAPIPFEITQDAYLRWEGLPRDQPIEIFAGRDQLDALFLGLRQSAIATSRLRDAFVLYSNGDLKGAQEGVEISGEAARHSYSNFNMFIDFVMRTAQPAEPPKDE